MTFSLRLNKDCLPAHSRRRCKLEQAVASLQCVPFSVVQFLPCNSSGFYPTRTDWSVEGFALAISPRRPFVTVRVLLRSLVYGQVTRRAQKREPETFCCEFQRRLFFSFDAQPAFWRPRERLCACLGAGKSSLWLFTTGCKAFENIKQMQNRLGNLRSKLPAGRKTDLSH